MSQKCEMKRKNKMNKSSKKSSVAGEKMSRAIFKFKFMGYLIEN